MVEVSSREKSLSVFAEASRLGHEQVVFCQDEPTGLKAIIGIHSTIIKIFYKLVKVQTAI